jgi:hypothetical protein
LDGAVPTHLVMEELTGEQHMTAEMSNGIDADISARRSKQMDRVLAEDAAHEAATGEPDWETSFETLKGAQSDYQGDMHRLINAELRGTVDDSIIDDFGEENLSLVPDYTDALDTLIDRGDALSADTTVYRGIRSDLLPELSGLEVGDTITDNGFMSTTMNPKIAVNFAGGTPDGVTGAVMRIKAPAGTKAWVMPPIGEAELLLPRGLQMRITGFSRKVIDVEIVGAEQRSGLEGRAMTSMVQMMQDGLDRFVTPLRLTGANGEQRYNPQQPRDGDGKWTSGGAMGGGADDGLTPEIQALRSSPPPAEGEFDRDMTQRVHDDFVAGVRSEVQDVPYARDAITSWQGNNYRRINGSIDSDGNVTAPRSSFEHGEITALDELMARCDESTILSDSAWDAGEPIVVFRGATNLRDAKVGDTIDNPGYLATSVSPHVAMEFSASAGAVLGTPKTGQPILRIEGVQHGIPMGGGEREMLLPRGMKLQITGREIMPVENGGIEVLVTKIVDHGVTDGGLSLEAEERYNPNQPRDGDGKWTSSGGMGGAADDALWTEQGTGGSAQVGALLQDQQEGYISSLDGDTHSALGSYTDSGYKSINKTLRGAPPPPVTDPDSIASSQRMAARIDTAVRNAPPLEQDVLVFRAVSHKAMPKIKTGAVVEDKGIVSTSVSSVVAGGFAADMSAEPVMMAIRVPKGSRALYVDSISANPGEDEVLLPMGTKMRMMGKLADGTIKMEVVQ